MNRVHICRGDGCGVCQPEIDRREYERDFPESDYIPDYWP